MYVEGQDYLWVVLMDDCMRAGGERGECIERLPPDVLAQLEAYEATRAAMRRRQMQQHSRYLEPDECAVGVKCL